MGIGEIRGLAVQFSVVIERLTSSQIIDIENIIIIEVIDSMADRLPCMINLCNPQHLRTVDLIPTSFSSCFPSSQTRVGVYVVNGFFTL